jgi:hypothetical protein
MTTTTDTPAAQLRAAAKLLRERAEKATPGPWKRMCLGSEGCLVIRDHATIRERGRGRVAKFGLNDWQADHADAEFVGSMDPVFAQAVADWLEATATEADDLIKQDTPDCGHEDDALGCHCDRTPVWGCDRCGEYLAPGACHCWDKALTVARAYLNSEEN